MWAGSADAQGIYALVSALGALFVRVVLQPFEVRHALFFAKRTLEHILTSHNDTTGSRVPATEDERRYDKFNSKAGSRSILFTKSHCAQEIQRLDENRCRSWIIVGFARSTILSFGA